MKNHLQSFLSITWVSIVFAQVAEIANFNTSNIDPTDVNRAWEQDLKSY